MHISSNQNVLTDQNVIVGNQGGTGNITGKAGCLFIFIVVWLMVVVFPVCAGAFEEFRIGTGGSTGVYYPIGKLIATGMTMAGQDKNSPLYGYIGVAQISPGSIENAKAIAEGNLDAGLVQANIAVSAYRGTGPFKNLPPLSSLRVVASLYPEKFQIVVRKDSGIHTVSDLRGKRISVDEKGSGTLAVMQIILSAHGMSLQDLQPLYLKPAFVQDRIEKGELQGFVMMAGVPMAAVTDLQNIGPNLVPIERRVAKEIYSKYPFLFPGEIAAGSYQGIPATDTVEVYALLVVNATATDGLVYDLTQSIFSEATARLLREGHRQGSEITIETALNGISIPLHPGAEKFYRDRGILK